MLCVSFHWKATIHIYNLKKFQNIQKFIAFTAAHLKSLNSIYGTHRPLGNKDFRFSCRCSKCRLFGSDCMIFESCISETSLVHSWRIEELP
jgi:hypothetical protein